MPIWIERICDELTTHWLSATLRDYGLVVLVVVVAGWITSVFKR